MPDLDEYAFIFDSNIFSRMIATNGEAYAQEVYNIVFSRFRHTGTSPYAFTTPSLILEHLGISPVFPNAQQFRLENDGMDVSQKMKAVFDFAFQHYRTLPELSLAHLQNRYNSIHAHANRFGQAILRDIVGTKINTHHLDFIHENLARDFFYGFNFKSITKGEDYKRIHISHLLDVHRLINNRSNISPVRGVYEVAEELRKRNRNAIDHILELLRVKNGLKLIGDRGDLDLIHFSVMGAILNNRKKVAIVTGDPIHDVTNRTKSYFAIVEIFLNQLSHSEVVKLDETFVQIHPTPGLIFALQQDVPELESLIDVTQLRLDSSGG